MPHHGKNPGYALNLSCNIIKCMPYNYTSSAALVQIHITKSKSDREGDMLGKGAYRGQLASRGKSQLYF